MNFKTTYALFGVLAVLLGVLAVVLVTGPTAPAGEKHVFPGMHGKDNPFNEEDAEKVVIQRKKPSDSEMVFERGEDKEWRIVEPRAVPADSREIGNLVSALRNARIDEENKPASLKQGGLDSPRRVITVTGKGREFTLTIGDTTPGSENAFTYVLSSDRKGQPLAVEKSQLDAAQENLNYFRQKNLLGSDTADIRGLRVSEGKKTPVELTKEKDRWKMVSPPYGYVDVSDLLNKVTDLRVHHKDDKDTDFVKDRVKDLAQYNLDADKSSVLRISVTRGEGKKAKTTTLLVGVGKTVDTDKKADKSKEKDKDKDKDKKEGKYYAALDEGGKTYDVVKVSAESVKPLVELIDDPGKYRSKSLVQLDNFKQPDAIDVVNSYGTLEFRKPDTSKPWELYRGGSANKVDETEVRKLIDELNKKDAVTSFVDAKRKKELGLEKPDVVVKVYADSLESPADKKDDKKKEEKKKDDKKDEKQSKPVFKKDAKPAAELRFGRQERDQVAVERVWGQDSAVVMVPQSLLDQVRKGPLAYLDRAIPPFNTAFGGADKDVTKVELTRDGETAELTRAAEKDPWTFVKPAGMKGRKVNADAVRGILDELNRLRAEEVVAEKPDQKELADRYHLLKPPVKVVVTLTKDKKPETHTFELGKDTGKGVYLKQGGKDVVYLVSPGVLNAVKKDLRDTTIFSFDPDKVTTLTLKGWKNLTGSVFTLSLEQKDGKWAVKSPPDFKLDGNKVTDLVRDLAHLHAERFVPSGKGLKLDEGALEVTIGLPDKKTHTLTVGAAEGGGSFYATSDQVKGEVLVIPKGSFEDVKKAPVYFQPK
jgi:hypothetical protein